MYLQSHSCLRVIGLGIRKEMCVIVRICNQGFRNKDKGTVTALVNFCKVSEGYH